MEQQQEVVGTPIPGEELPQNTENTVEEPQNTEVNDVETRARAMGWRPADEFNGDLAKWRSAEDFVAKGETDLPVLRENLRRMTSTISDLQTRLSRQDQEFKASIDRLDKMSSAALQRQKETLEASYQSAMRNAAANGDVEAYDRLEVGRRQAVGEFDEQISEVVQKQVAGPSPAVNVAENPAFKQWHAKNDWFLKDHEMSAVAQLFSQRNAQQRPDISLEANLAETEAYMRKRYPEKFGVPTPSPSPVEGGGSRMSHTMSRGKGWNEMPADAKAQGAKFIKDGLFKDQNDYAKEYWSA